jgi:hypothetical protein
MKFVAFKNKRMTVRMREGFVNFHDCALFSLKHRIADIYANDDQ